MLFDVYAFFLIASGVLMLVLGFIRAPYARRGRVFNLIVGAGFSLYGLYLLLFLHSGHYFIFYYAFILPIILLFRFFRDRAAYGRRGMMASGAYGSTPPPGYGGF